MIRQLELRLGSAEEIRRLFELIRPLTEEDDLFHGAGIVTGEYPPLNIFHSKEGGVLLQLGAAGIEPDEISISVEDRTVEISGLRQNEGGKRVRKSVRLERYCGEFRRTIELPFHIDERSVKAEMAAGEILVHLNPCPQRKHEPRRVVLHPSIEPERSGRGCRHSRGEDKTSGDERLPFCDIFEDREAYTLYVDMPGVKQENVEIAFDGDMLSLAAATRNSIGESSKENHLAYCEFDCCDYRRVFVLTSEIDFDRHTATMANGVLRVELPKRSRIKSPGRVIAFPTN